MLLLTITGALAAGGSAASTSTWSARRTPGCGAPRSRPLATGAIRPLWGLVRRVACPAGGLALLAGNPGLAFFLAPGAFIYLGVYTLWLRRAPRSTS